MSDIASSSNPSPQQSPNPTSTDNNANNQDGLPNLQKRAQQYLRELPGLLKALVRDPAAAIKDLPQTGSWEKPIFYALTSGLIGGFATSALMLATFQMFIFTGIIYLTLASGFGVFLGGFVYNLLLGAVGKDPGLYRTILFGSLLSFINIVNVITSVFSPWLALAPSAYGAYLIFHYAQSAASWKRQHAIYLGAAIFALCALSLLRGYFFSGFSSY